MTYINVLSNRHKHANIALWLRRSCEVLLTTHTHPNIYDGTRTCKGYNQLIQRNIMAAFEYKE